MPVLSAERDRQRAARTEQKFGGQFTDPFARFNLSLGGNNPDWLPTQNAGIGDLFVRHVVPELTRKIRVETGQLINTRLFNPDLLAADERKRGLVYVTEFNTSINQGTPDYRLQALAKQLGCPVLGLDNPTMGGSSRYTTEQYKALRNDQDFGPTAEALVDAIQKSGLKEISLVGVSMGGWAAPVVARIAQERGIQVDDIVIVAAPGAQKRKRRTLIFSELKEGSHLELYQSRPYDPEMRRAAGMDSSGGIKRTLGLTKVLTRVFLHPMANLALVGAMAKGTIEEQVRSAFTDPSGKESELHVTFIGGTSDSVSIHEANNQVVSRLKQEFPGQIHQIVIPGETHFLYENGNRFAAFVGLSLADSPLLKRKKES